MSSWAQDHPIGRLSCYMMNQGWWTEQDEKNWKKKSHKEVSECKPSLPRSESTNLPFCAHRGRRVQTFPSVLTEVGEYKPSLLCSQRLESTNLPFCAHRGRGVQTFHSVLTEVGEYKPSLLCSQRSESTNLPFCAHRGRRLQTFPSAPIEVGDYKPSLLRP